MEAEKNGIAVRGMEGDLIEEEVTMGRHADSEVSFIGDIHA